MNQRRKTRRHHGELRLGLELGGEALRRVLPDAR